MLQKQLHFYEKSNIFKKLADRQLLFIELLGGKCLNVREITFFILINKVV